MGSKIGMIKNFIKDPNKKSIFLIAQETMSLWKELKHFPIHYYTRLTYRNKYKNYRAFIDNSIVRKIKESRNLHKKETIDVLEDKVNFWNFCNDNSILTPKVLAFNNYAKLRIEDKFYDIDNFESFTLNLKVVLNHSKSKDIFLKPTNGAQGKECFKILESDLNKTEYMKKIYSTIIDSNFVFQETISQHYLLKRINPTSINTIRIDTFITNDGTPEVLSALIRFGRKGSVVDNPFNSGGFFVPINLEKGTLIAPGMQLLGVGNGTFYEHPDSKLKLDNYEIPFLKETIELVKNAAIKIGDRLVGWDVAITEDGPLIIEGNHDYHLGMQDVAYGGYKKHPIFNEILKEI